MANQPHEMLRFPRVEGHEMPCLPHDMAIEYFMGVSALFHRIVPSSVFMCEFIEIGPSINL